METEKRTHNKSICNSRAGRWSNWLQIFYQLQFGLIACPELVSGLIIKPQMLSFPKGCLWHNNKIKINFGTGVTECYYPAIANTDSLAEIFLQPACRQNFCNLALKS